MHTAAKSPPAAAARRQPPISTAMASPSPKREVHLRTKDITEDDLTLLADLDAVAQLQRTTRSAVIANLFKRTLPPHFPTHVAAA